MRAYTYESLLLSLKCDTLVLMLPIQLYIDILSLVNLCVNYKLVNIFMR